MPLNLRQLQACQIPSLIRHRRFDVTEGAVLTEETTQNAHWILRLMQACEILPSSALEVRCNRGARVWYPTLRFNTRRQKESRHSGGHTHIQEKPTLTPIWSSVTSFSSFLASTTESETPKSSTKNLSLFFHYSCPGNSKNNSCSSSHYSTYVSK
jgi:hypothetical protein